MPIKKWKKDRQTVVHPHNTVSFFPGGSEGEESTCNAGHPSSVPGVGRSPGEGNDSPRQYSCLGNPMDRGAWRATGHKVPESRTWLSDSHFHFHFQRGRRFWRMLQHGWNLMTLHWVTWAVTKRQVLHNSIYMRCWKSSNSKTERRLGAARGWAGVGSYCVCRV